MNKIKAFSYIGLALLLVIVAVIGCQPAVEKPNDPNNNMNNNRGNNNMGNDNMRNNNMDKNNMDKNNIEDGDGIIDGDDDTGNRMNNMNNNDMTQRSERITQALLQMNEVRRAAVVISDNTAIVGVDMANNNANRVSEDMRRRIESTVRTTDNRINEVRVTTDQGMYDRINNVVLSMRRGRPVTEFTNEIRDIMDMITRNM